MFDFFGFLVGEGFMSGWGLLFLWCVWVGLGSYFLYPSLLGFGTWLFAVSPAA